MIPERLLGNGFEADIPQHLLLPSDGSVRLPVPAFEGRFLATPRDVWAQLVDGVHNPSFGAAQNTEEAIMYVDAWRSQVINTDEAIRTGDQVYFGSHITNMIARVACSPFRTSVISLKNEFKREEASAPRQAGRRDPEQLSVLYNSLRSVIGRLHSE